LTANNIAALISRQQRWVQGWHFKVGAAFEGTTTSRWPGHSRVLLQTDQGEVEQKGRSKSGQNCWIGKNHFQLIKFYKILFLFFFTKVQQWILFFRGGR